MSLMVWPLNVHYSLTSNGGQLPTISEILPVHAHHSEIFLTVGQLLLWLCAKFQVSISSKTDFYLFFHVFADCGFYKK